MEPRDKQQGHAAEAEPGGETAAFDPAPYRPSRRALGWSAAAAAGLLGCLAVLGVVPRVTHRAALAVETRTLEEEPVRVSVVRGGRLRQAL